MGGLTLHASGAEIKRFATLMRQARGRAPLALKRALNHTGDKAVTGMVRALTKQTGLPRRTIVKALKKTRAGEVYTIRSAGGDIRLKFFGPRQASTGVSAAPWGQRRVFPGTFMRGGRSHTIPIRNGQIYIRTGASRLPIKVARSDLFIPDEMVNGATAETFLKVTETDLPARLEYELLRVIG